MNYELLSPDTLTPQLKRRRLELHNLLTLKLKTQKNTPDGHLRIEQKNGGRRIQFYHCTSKPGNRGAYIPGSQAALARDLAQKDYDHKLIKLLQRELSILDKFLKNPDTKITERYTKLCDTRQRLITPVTLTDDQYAAAWSSQKYVGKPFQPDATEYYTARGERVRSKSEVIIADTLARLNIPYCYEYPLTLNGGGRHGASVDLNRHDHFTVYPDFLCLNLRTRQEFLWEHFGLMDDADYSCRAVQKLHTYAENGIFPGQNLIISTETVAIPLNTRHLELLINNFLK